MNKLIKLIAALKKLDIDHKHINSVYDLYKSAALSPSSTKDKKDRSRSFLYGEEGTEQDPPTDTPPQQNNPPQTPPNDTASARTISIPVKCGDKEFNLIQAFNFQENKFNNDDCVTKICTLRHVLEKKNATALLLYLNLIVESINHYKANLTNEEFKTFISQKIAAGEGTRLEWARRLVSNFQDSSEEEIKTDLAELLGLNEDSDLINSKLKDLKNNYFIPEDLEELNDNSIYVYKALFFKFCSDNLNKMISDFLSKTLTSNTEGLDPKTEQFYIEKFAEWYNSNSQSYADCFSFSKINTSFENKSIIEKEDYSNKMTFEEAEVKKETTNSLSKIFVEAGIEGFEDQVVDYAREAGQHMAKELAKLPKKQKNNYLTCARSQYAKEERDRSIVSGMMANIGEDFNKNSYKYFIPKEAALEGLWILSSKQDILPIEAVELLYKKEGSKDIELSAIGRLKNQSQNTFIESLKQFSDKYVADATGSNPFELFKDKTANSKYEDNYVTDDSIKTEVVNYDTKSQYVSAICDNILDSHRAIAEKVAEYYNDKQSQPETMFDFYKNIFVNKEKELLERLKPNLENLNNGYKKSSILLSNLTGEKGLRESDFTVDPKKRSVKYYNIKNKSEHYYIPSSKEGSLTNTDRRGRRYFKSGDKTFIREKNENYAYKSSFSLQNYGKDLEKIIESYNKSDVGDTACSFETGSELFETICNKTNSSGVDEIDGVLKGLISGLFYETSCIGNVQLAFKNRSLSEETKKALIATISKLSPDQEKIDEINRTIQQDYKKAVEQAIESLKNKGVTPATYREYKYSKYKRPFQNPPSPNNPKDYCERTRWLDANMKPEWNINWNDVKTAEAKTANGKTQFEQKDFEKLMESYREAMINLLIESKNEIQ